MSDAFKKYQGGHYTGDTKCGQEEIKSKVVTQPSKLRAGAKPSGKSKKKK